MGAKPSSFKKKLLASSISSCLFASMSAVAQTDSPAAVEEVIVLGVRGAQESAVNLKRDASAVVDGIVAEDIGKLPDATISDSLQRISGIQIRRSAGEGGAVNIRGLPQVITQLNGEEYLGAGSITTTQPSFGDIPSQLFRGADVYKSATANLGIAGITGTVNLKTFRPFDLSEGLTASGSVELQSGAETSETDPVLSGLVGWQNERVGALLSVAYANVNLSNYYNGANTGNPTGDVGWSGTSTAGVDGATYQTISEQGVAAWNQVTERERIGMNGSFQADLGEGFEFIADWFYTNQDEYNRKIGLSATNKWQGSDWYDATVYRPTGVSVGGTEFATVQEYVLDVRRLKSFTQNDSFLSDSRNLNLQVNYDNGGPLTGSVRYISGEANRKRRHGYNEGDMTDGSTTGINPFYPSSLCEPGDNVQGDEGGCFKSPNPLGYNANPQIVYNTQGEHARWGGFDEALDGGLPAGSTVADYMGNLSSYNIGAFSSENNADSIGTIDVFRLDGSYEFSDATPFVTSIDLGVRTSQRSVSEERFHLFSPFYEEGCLVQWKATDVVLNSSTCSAGEMIANPNAGEPILDGDGEPTGEVQPDEIFQGYTALPPTALNQHNNVTFVTDFGPVDGIPGVWAVDPKDYDDPEAFHNRVFGSTVRAVIPGTSYNIDLDTQTFYVQANFEAGIVSGNIGIRRVETELTVKQNQIGAGILFGNTNVDAGDALTKREYSDTLPSVNVSVDVSEEVKLRFAASKNMVPLDLNNWGDGLAINTALDADTGVFRVTTATLNGNPELNPWRSNNFDASAEWYLGSASVVSLGAFYVEVDSFTTAGTIPMQLADADGRVNTIDVTAQVQGDGGSLKGVELGAKFAFSDFTDSFLGNFGVDTNYTHSPSEQEALDAEGSRLPFPENSENQFNLIGWYQDDRFQARIAYNYRSDRLQAQNQAGSNLALYQAPTSYVDVSASYDITDALTVYVNGSNITQEFEDYYLQWEDQYAFQNYYEPRYTIGIRARF